MRELVRLDEKILGKGHASYAMDLSDLAELLISQVWLMVTRCSDSSDNKKTNLHVLRRNTVKQNHYTVKHSLLTETSTETNTRMWP